MRLRLAVLLLASLSPLACLHRNPNEQIAPRPDPIEVRVKNENYLDVNVALVVSGVSHRLGTVTGNAAGTFHVPYSLVQSESFYVVGTPIGGSERYVSPPVVVAEGQLIEFRIASFLRQSTVVVREP
ncbi:MAG TPA: hypothetical protein VHB25_03655 [Gemmatimonadaceae bacterium]|nr:hypothetical protein [Gemmatimonadaceae bacterium]